MFALLLACAPLAPVTTEAPVNWFYADDGQAIDWSSVTWSAGDVVFRTIGAGLDSGPVHAPWVGTLACDEATRVTLAFVDGEVVDVHTFPENPCVAGIADRIDWSSLDLGGTPVWGVSRALVVLDVPGEEVAWASS